MENNVYISLYQYSGTVRVYRSVIRGIGDPRFIRFFVSNDAASLLVQAYHKKDFSSFRVPPDYKDDDGKIQIYSKGFCEIVASIGQWKANTSYRIPGVMLPKQHVAVFDLTHAERIHEA